MSETRDGFPRRDAEGRIIRLADLLGVVLAGLAVGLLAVLVLDWAFTLVGMGEFGRANGWLAVILPAWLFVEEFRAWAFGAVRVAAAIVSTVLAVTVGLLAAGMARDLPPLWSGALAALGFTLVYAVTWFTGVRWLDRRTN